MTDALAAWIKAHWLIDPLLHIAAVVGLVAIILVGLAAILYSAWFLLRLVRPKHIKQFWNKPIPGIIKGGVGPASLEFDEEPKQLVLQFEQQTMDAVANLQARISKVESQFARWEDTVGRA